MGLRPKFRPYQWVFSVNKRCCLIHIWCWVILIFPKMLLFLLLLYPCPFPEIKELMQRILEWFRSAVRDVAEYVRKVPGHFAGVQRARILLRWGDERVFLRPRSGHIPAHSQLLPDWKTALPQAWMSHQVSWHSFQFLFIWSPNVWFHIAICWYSVTTKSWHSSASSRTSLATAAMKIIATANARTPNASSTTRWARITSKIAPERLINVVCARKCGGPSKTRTRRRQRWYFITWRASSSLSASWPT